MNENLSLIYSAIDATKKAISDGDKTQAEKCGWELCNCFEENFVKIQCKNHDHITPFETIQNFTFCCLKRIR